MLATLPMWTFLSDSFPSSSNMSLNFAIVGVGGFIAPRHLKAIRDTGNRLVAAMDPNDSVGIIDSYFPDADFFVDFERFDRHVEKLRRSNSERKVDFVSICSPNHLHDAHIRFALRSGANAVCEKPLVLNPWNIDALKEIENDSPGRVFTVLQLRLHPAVLALKDMVMRAEPERVFDVDLTYITSRGKWYQYSWKGDSSKSGGVATNIGVHFFDMLHFVFGALKRNVLHHRENTRAAGYLEYEKARVRWMLSVEAADLPLDSMNKGHRTHRSLTIDGNAFEFSEGFTELHTRIYEDIMSGGGFGLEENRTAIQTVSEIRGREPIGAVGDYHPILKQIRI
jgi:UDP-N-acetyl-2-amino-2-deoxyglucuronate dehydrogenase